jgi:hypothetical protein
MYQTRRSLYVYSIYINRCSCPLTDMLGASRRLLRSRSALATHFGCSARTLHSSSLNMSNLANFKAPSVSNEPNKHYAKGSPDRDSLASAISAFAKKAPLEIPIVIGGKSVGRPYYLPIPGRSTIPKNLLMVLGKNVVNPHPTKPLVTFNSCCQIFQCVSI